MFVQSRPAASPCPCRPTRGPRRSARPRSRAAAPCRARRGTAPADDDVARPGFGDRVDERRLFGGRRLEGEARRRGKDHVAATIFGFGDQNDGWRHESAYHMRGTRPMRTSNGLPALLARLDWPQCLWGATVLAVSSERLANRAGRRRLASTSSARSAHPRGHLLECHSQDKRKGGLSLATYEDVLEGGRSGAVVRPGNSAGSLIIHRLTGAIEPQMPKDEVPLDAAEIALDPPVDRSGRARDADVAAGAAALGSAAGADGPPAPAVAGAAGRRRSIASSPPTSPSGSAGTGARSPTRCSRGAPIWTSGVCCRRRTSCRRSSPTARPTSATRWSRTLLADDQKYAEHWISFWNDLLRNEDGVTYFSETAGRKSITAWLLAALESNLPYDQFVAKLLNPTDAGRSRGFLVGVNWRGETSAAVTPWMQASQNTAQVFLGVNLKCNACHDSFVSKWKLKDAYALAAYFSPEAEAAALSLRRRAGRLRRARLPVSRAEPRAAVGLARRSPRHGGGDLHRSAQRPAAAHARQPALAPPARPRHRRQPGRDGRQAVEPGAARLARQRLRRARLRPQAPDSAAS